jgi:hypothetical protein
VSEGKPVVQLVGANGNAFVIMALCRAAAWRAGWDAARISAMMAEMRSGNYDHLLTTVMKHFDVR